LFDFTAVCQTLKCGICVRNILNGVSQNTQSSAHFVDSMIMVIGSMTILRTPLLVDWYLIIFSVLALCVMVWTELLEALAKTQTWLMQGLSVGREDLREKH